MAFPRFTPTVDFPKHQHPEASTFPATDQVPMLPYYNTPSTSPFLLYQHQLQRTSTAEVSNAKGELGTSRP